MFESLPRRQRSKEKNNRIYVKEREEERKITKGKKRETKTETRKKIAFVVLCNLFKYTFRRKNESTVRWRSRCFGFVASVFRSRFVASLLCRVVSSRAGIGPCYRQGGRGERERWTGTSRTWSWEQFPHLLRLSLSLTLSQCLSLSLSLSLSLYFFYSVCV